MAAPPAAVIAERRIARRLRHRGAVTPETAIFYEPSQFVRKRALARLIDAGVVKSAGPRLYLDEVMWAARRARQRRRALGILLIGAAVAGVAALIGRA